MDELYLCLNTDLCSHDLTNLVWEDLFSEWFTPLAAATEKGEILFGDFADDTKLDGRGKLLLPNEIVEDQITKTQKKDCFQDNLKATMNFLDIADTKIQQDNSSFELSIIGSVPSACRVKKEGEWRPRFAPSFSFKPGKSSLELSLFDSSWLEDRDDFEVFITRLENLTDSLGERRISQIEFEVSGSFEVDQALWRMFFDNLPVVKSIG